jgi:membrane fusion protein, adhesin transport system
MLMRRLEDLPDQLKPRSASNLLLWGITAFVLIFFTWAYLAEIERTVRGQGRVIPSSQLQVVSNNEGGIVQDILVRSGDMVRAGAPLIRLDPTATGSELGSGEASYNALLIKIARLEAEVAGRAPTYPSPPDPQAAEQIRIEQALHASRIADLASISGAAEARVAQARRAVAEAEAAYQARVTNRDARIREANIIRPLVERGIEPRLSLVQAESAASIASSEAAGAAQSIARAQASVVEAQQALSQLRQNWPPPRPKWSPVSALSLPSPSGSTGRCCAPRSPGASTASSSPPAAAPSRPPSPWSRSCRPTTACWSRRG